MDNAKLNIDRNFLLMRNEALLTFAERVLRNMEQNPYIKQPEGICERLATAVAQLRDTTNDRALKGKFRTEAIRQMEVPIHQQLGHLADYVEDTCQCKSDINTTGFRPQSEQRRDSVARRTARVSERMQVLGLPTR